MGAYMAGFMLYGLWLVLVLMAITITYGILMVRTDERVVRVGPGNWYLIYAF